MKFLKSVYLADRLFYALAACIVLFLLSFSWPLLVYPAIAAVALTALALLADVFILFRAQLLTAERLMANVFSLHDSNTVIIQLRNLSTVRLKLKIIDEIPYQFSRRDLYFKLKAGPGEHIRLRYELVPVTRGEYSFGDLQLFAHTGIGLVSKRETISCQRKVAVYPSVMQMSRQELAAMHHPAFTQGENRNRKLGQSYEFDQVKVYLPGDDTRRINWKASSTQGEVMVNSYEDERSQPVYSIIDKSRVMKMPFKGLTLLDYSINAALAFSNIVLKKQDKAGLILFSRKTDSLVKADRGQRHLKKIMYSLYKEKYDYSEADYEGLYSAIRRHIPNRSLLFLYTSFDSLHAMERNLPVLRLINKYHLLVVVFFENSELAEYSRSEAATVHEIYQITIAKKFILEKSQIERELLRHGIHSIRTTPEKLSTQAINKYLEFKSRGVY